MVYTSNEATGYEAPLTAARGPWLWGALGKEDGHQRPPGQFLPQENRQASVYIQDNL